MSEGIGGRREVPVEHHRWQDELQHDGVVVVDLRLLTAAEGGRDRAIQSGYRAEWVVGEHRTTGPILLTGGRRSVKPGERATVEVHPLAPADWRAAGPGTAVRLYEGARAIGLGSVRRVERLPAHDVPLAPGGDRPDRRLLTYRPRPRPRWRGRRGG
jgi:hypothetical protein